MRKMLILALTIWPAPLAAQQVEVAGGNWSEIPEVRSAGHGRISDAALDKAALLLSRDGACATGKSTIDLTVPFLLQFDPHGAVTKAVVHRTGCPELEKLVGGVVLTLARAVSTGLPARISPIGIAVGSASPSTDKETFFLCGLRLLKTAQ